MFLAGFESFLIGGRGGGEQQRAPPRSSACTGQEGPARAPKAHLRCN
jgi:hypothetical protein